MISANHRINQAQERLNRLIAPCLQHTSFTLFTATLCMMVAMMPAHAFSSTNLHRLYGDQFDNNFYGNNTSNAKLTTITLEHFSSWSYGDNYFFVDLLSGNFLRFSGTPSDSQSRIYAEWTPRLSFSVHSGRDISAAVFKDFFLAAQLNRDDRGFHTEMIDLSTDLNIFGFHFLSSNIYLRKDNLNRLTWQSTTAWQTPLNPCLSFEGCIDLYVSDNNGIEIHTQPQLFINLRSLAGTRFDKFFIGIEWYCHHNRHLDSNTTQAMIKWTC